MTSPLANLELAIGELRLSGFDPLGRADLADRIQAALSARLSADAEAWQGCADLSLERIDLGPVQPGTTRQATADRIAERIHGALASQRDAARQGH